MKKIQNLGIVPKLNKDRRKRIYFLRTGIYLPSVYDLLICNLFNIMNQTTFMYIRAVTTVLRYIELFCFRYLQKLSLIYIIAAEFSAIIDLFMIKNEKADYTDEIIIRSVDLYDDLFLQCWSRCMLCSFDGSRYKHTHLLILLL